MTSTPIAKAIRRAGSQAKLGAMLDPPRTQQAVSKMLRAGYCTPDVAAQIVDLFPGRFTYAGLTDPRYRQRPLAQAHRPDAGVLSYKD